MQDLKKLGEELRKNGQAERLKTLAASADGQKLGQMADRAAMADALRRGDSEALRQAVLRLMASSEGQRLSAEVEKLLRGNGHD